LGIWALVLVGLLVALWIDQALRFPTWSRMRPMGLLARPGSPPGARWAAMYVDSSWVVLSTLLGLVLLPTPTGRLPSPHWRWWAGWSWR
jgi:hypothetical protein